MVNDEGELKIRIATLAFTRSKLKRLKTCLIVILWTNGINS